MYENTTDRWGALLRRWRVAGAGVAGFGALVAVACFLPWAERATRLPDGTATSVRTVSGFDAGRLSLIVLAFGLSAVLIGLLCAANHPADPRLGPALSFNTSLPAAGLAAVILAAVQAGQGTSAATPQYGAFVAAAGLAGWLVCGLVMRRVVSVVRGSRPVGAPR